MRAHQGGPSSALGLAYEIHNSRQSKRISARMAKRIGNKRCSKRKYSWYSKRSKLELLDLVFQTETFDLVLAPDKDREKNWITLPLQSRAPLHEIDPVLSWIVLYILSICWAQSSSLSEQQVCHVYDAFHISGFDM